MRTYLYLASVIGGTSGVLSVNEWEWWWNVPVTLLAIMLIGAGQHQLTGLAHEASHHILFQESLMNDLVSDWLCMFPLFSRTQHYRLQHLAHHQFVNDPERDPDISQLQTSGHWLHFPVDSEPSSVTLVKQLWLPNLFRLHPHPGRLQRHPDRQESVSQEGLEAEQNGRARRHPLHAR